VHSTAPRTGRHLFAGPAAFAVVCCLWIGILGCGGRNSTSERLEKAYQSSSMKPVAVYPFAGKVTIDHGQPQAGPVGSVLVVVAYDTSAPGAPAIDNAVAIANGEGSFEFDGGLRPGKYVMLFAQLKRTPRGNFRSGDAFNNLYNDPDVNAKKPEFVIDHEAPGKTNYEFNLTVAGETPVETPGPKALVGSRRGRK
jgi:hypothetical protein